MSQDETRVWGIHAGKTGDADTLFLKRNFVAIGWPKMGDLTKLGPDRDAFKSKFAAVYPNAKPGAIPTNAGQLFRFAHEMKTSDLVVYRSKLDKHFHIGRVDGPYKYDATLESSYPHLRAVRWLRSAPRGLFTQGALYELGSAMNFFQLKTYVEEFRAAAEDKETVPTSSDDPTVKIVADEIEENTYDFIIKRLAQELKGHPMAEFVGHLLETMGYRTRISPEGPDGGIDIIAHKDELGFEPPIIKVQVKSTESSIGDPVVASLYGKVGAADYGLFVTLGAFTTQARNFERGKSNLRLIDGEQLVELVIDHYDQLDARYKGLIPLKRVYVPELIEESDE